MFVCVDGLGLGIYADSDGSDDEAVSSGDDSRNDSETNAGDESDAELRVSKYKTIIFKLLFNDLALYKTKNCNTF